ITWNDRKVHIGGIGGVSTRQDCRRLGYASLALNAAIRTMRDQETVRFGLLFCEPHNFAFYQSRGWHPFTGEIYAEQPGGKIRFEAMAPFVFDFGRAPREGVIALGGWPWCRCLARRTPAGPPWLVIRAHNPLLSPGAARRYGIAEIG